MEVAAIYLTSPINKLPCNKKKKEKAVRANTPPFCSSHWTQYFPSELSAHDSADRRLTITKELFQEQRHAYVASFSRQGSERKTSKQGSANEDKLSWHLPTTQRFHEGKRDAQNRKRISMLVNQVVFVLMIQRKNQKRPRAGPWTISMYLLTLSVQMLLVHLLQLSYGVPGRNIQHQAEVSVRSSSTMMFLSCFADHQGSGLLQ